MATNNEYGMHGKIPPQCTDVEESILGVCMIENGAFGKIAGILSEDCFYKSKNRVIFGACKQLFVENKPIDLLSVTEELKRQEKLEEVGGAYHLTQLTDRVSSSANIEYHARLVQEKYLMRKMIQLSDQNMRNSYLDSTNPIDELEKDISQRIKLLNQTILIKRTEHIREVTKRNLDEISKIVKNEMDSLGVLTGLKDIDDITNGFQYGNMIIIAGRPSMGKTALAMTLVYNMAVVRDVPVGIFSLEMTAEEVALRIISIDTKKSVQQLRSKDQTTPELSELYEKVKKINKHPIYINDDSKLSIIDFKAKVIDMIKAGVKIIFIDYIQLMKPTDRRMQRHDAVNEISMGIKEAAKEHKIPIVALSQLARSSEDSKDKRPQLRHLRETGQLEADADLVGLLYRAEYYKITEDKNGNPTDNIAEFDLAKHRNGATGMVEMYFNKKIMMFTDKNGDEGMDDGLKKSDKPPF